jgi:hypothetical protein
MSEGGWDHTKLMREVVGSVLGQKNNLKPIKNEFSLERQKRGA